MSRTKSDHTLEAHQIVSPSSARSSVPHLQNSDENTHTPPRLGGGRILKTNKQRIDLLRRIAEVLITSDPSPLLSESASHSSLILSAIYDLTHSLSHNLGFYYYFQGCNNLALRMRLHHQATPICAKQYNNHVAFYGIKGQTSR